MMLPIWAQLILGLLALAILTVLGSYLALGKTEFRNRAASSVASAILGFILTPVFVIIAGLIGIPGMTSAFLMLMWAVLFRNLQKLKWPSSMGLALACTMLTYALVSWAGFVALLEPWWLSLRP